MVIRLIDVATQQLSAHEGEEVPEYAILSHTWVSGEEVTFHEMQELYGDSAHPARKKSGYDKIIATCTKAQKHGVSYVWVDTCCIDKRDPTELGEAINSMFKFYTEAKICFAYLADLIWEHDGTHLYGCRWFTRGWCLQELIAPKVMKFYDKNWQSIGSRNALSEYIVAITKIDASVLRHEGSLDMIPIARKMSWAAKRQTTRIEDMAYCLLGIFDIHMPLLYGEGANAFIRLQEEIIKQSDDLSIFAPLTERLDGPTGKATPCDLFASSPKAFETFSTIKKELESMLQSVYRAPDFLESMGDRPSTFHPSILTNQSRHFAITNRGLYFEAPPFFLNARYRIFLMYLPYNLASERMTVFFKKVGTGMYVPLKTTKILGESWDTGLATDANVKNVYIARKMALSTNLLIQLSKAHTVHFEIEQWRPEDVSKSLVPVESEALWDHSRSGFLLTSYFTTFTGALRVHLGKTYIINDVQNPPIFYVVFEVWKRSTDYHKLLLFSKKEWENMRLAAGTQGDVATIVDHMSLEEQADHETLQFDRWRVIANIEREKDGHIIKLKIL
ncbi:hypothetical protein M426DRAFT_318279 [Hypoxylon sp. CI-4A]|nr:hypothetical protein M426DRAFT_318279 [Hypoxylon sp. CI-4A]